MLGTKEAEDLRKAGGFPGKRRGSPSRWMMEGERLDGEINLVLEWPGVLRLDGLASGKLSEVVSSPRAWKGVATLGRVWRGHSS